MLITWSEFPYDGDDSHIRTFQGNILQFYNFVRHLPHGVTIYEIFKRCGGYFDDSIVFGTENRYNQFIARKFQLTIHYTI